jgi:NAD(P)-dependent dehydrogenase (short-subunit alcohol dehydrogenase family)
MSHPALAAGRAAVITGAASGIGLAAAKRFAAAGMRLCLADSDAERLRQAGAEIAALARGGNADIRTVATDVALPADVERLKQTAYAAFGEVALLMNNAAIGQGAGPWQDSAQWRRLMEINFFGVLNGLQSLVPDMIAQGSPCAIVNTGSKQGITTPPGNAAYNVSKAAVKVLTEQLAHELRQIDGCQVTAHLLVPGHTFTGMTARGRTEKPASAWMPDQVVQRLVDGMAAGDFYIICADNETTPEMDAKRMRWAVGDIIENRPALSRWHPDYKDAFAAFMKG